MALGMMKKLSSPHKSLNFIAAEIALRLEKYRVQRVVLRHLRGSLNIEADWLSRILERNPNVGWLMVLAFLAGSLFWALIFKTLHQQVFHPTSPTHRERRWEARESRSLSPPPRMRSKSPLSGRSRSSESMNSRRTPLETRSLTEWPTPRRDGRSQMRLTPPSQGLEEGELQVWKRQRFGSKKKGDVGHAGQRDAKNDAERESKPLTSRKQNKKRRKPMTSQSSSRIQSGLRKQRKTSRTGCSLPPPALLEMPNGRR